MNHQSKMGRAEFPLMSGFFWFFASVVGLWFVVRNADIGAFPKDVILMYVVFLAGNFVAFGWGWYWGAVYYEWWAGYVIVFVSAAVLSVALWIWWYVNVNIPATLPLAQNESWLNAARISNLSGALFIVLIIPACYGVYHRQGYSLDQGKKRIATALQSFETMQKLVIAYGAVLETLDRGKTFISEDLLPASTLELKRALITVARAAKSKGDTSSLNVLHKYYMFLACFVPEQEAEIMDRFHSLNEEILKKDPSNERIADIIEEISKDRRYREIEKRISDEFVRLSKEFDEEVEREAL